MSRARPQASEEGDALEEIAKYSVRLSLAGAVTDEAARICTRSLELGISRRRPRAQVMASALYAACRVRDVPTTLDDVARASGVRKVELARHYRLLVNGLNLEIPVADPAECLATVASRARVGPKVEADAREILSKAEKAGITAGSYPIGLAASALYVASILDGKRLTQSEAADAAGVKDATVRKQYKRLRKVLGVELGRSRRKKSPGQADSEEGRSSPFEARVEPAT